MAKILLWFGLIMVVMMGLVVWQWPDGKLRLTMCDVGQGDAFVLSRNFSQWVIDTGTVSGGVEACLGNVLPFWDKTVEVILITHADADHSGALASLSKRYVIKKVLMSADTKANLANEVVDRLNVNLITQGDTLSWEGIVGEVLWPPNTKKIKDVNEGSIVLRIMYGNSSVLFTGDITEQVEQQLIDQQLIKPTQMLKLAHHGAKTATSEPFLSVLRPRQALISVGSDNKYGHPSKDVIERLHQFEVDIYRTDDLGIWSTVLE